MTQGTLNPLETWQAWNNGSGKRMWFLARIVDGVTEYHWSRSGVLIRYASYKTAGKVAARLNHASECSCCSSHIEKRGYR